MTAIYKRVEGGWQEADGGGGSFGPVIPDYGPSFLDQNETWTDIKGVTHRLEDMSLGYLLNVRRMLLRQAWSLELKDSVRSVTSFWWPQGDMAQFYAEQELDRRMEDPEGWLLSTPLLRRIDELVIAARGDGEHYDDDEVC